MFDDSKITIEERKTEGEIFLKDHLEHVELATNQLFFVIAGLRRDLKMSVFPVTINPISDGWKLSGLANVLRKAFSLIEFDTKSIKNNSEKDIIHKNLVDLSKTAIQLYNILSEASLHFYEFNGDNASASYEDADIDFDKDSMDIAMTTARGISEMAVRLDIDLIGG